MAIATPPLDQVIDLARRLPREQREQLIARLEQELAAEAPPERPPALHCRQPTTSRQSDRLSVPAQAGPVQPCCDSPGSVPSRRSQAAPIVWRQAMSAR